MKTLPFLHRPSHALGAVASAAFALSIALTPALPAIALAASPKSTPAPTPRFVADISVEPHLDTRDGTEFGEDGVRYDLVGTIKTKVDVTITVLIKDFNNPNWHTAQTIPVKGGAEPFVLPKGSMTEKGPVGASWFASCSSLWVEAGFAIVIANNKQANSTTFVWQETAKFTGWTYVPGGHPEDHRLDGFLTPPSCDQVAPDLEPDPTAEPTPDDVDPTAEPTPVGGSVGRFTPTPPPTIEPSEGDEPSQAPGGVIVTETPLPRGCENCGPGGGVSGPNVGGSGPNVVTPGDVLFKIGELLFVFFVGLTLLRVLYHRIYGHVTGPLAHAEGSGFIAELRAMRDDGIDRSKAVGVLVIAAAIWLIWIFIILNEVSAAGGAIVTVLALGLVTVGLVLLVLRHIGIRRIFTFGAIVGVGLLVVNRLFRKSGSDDSGGSYGSSGGGQAL